MLGWLPRNNSPRSETYGSDNWYISLYVTAQLLSLGAVGSVLCKLSSFSQVHAMLLSLHSARSLNAVKSAPFISPDNGFSKGKSYNCVSYRHISFRYIVHCTSSINWIFSRDSYAAESLSVQFGILETTVEI